MQPFSQARPNEAAKLTCKRRPQPVALCLLGTLTRLALIATSIAVFLPSGAAQWSYAKIADQNTAIPGYTGAFSAFDTLDDEPSISEGNVAFMGYQAPFFSVGGYVHKGVYGYLNNVLQMITDNHHLAINASFDNDWFDRPDIDGTLVAGIGVNAHSRLGGGVFVGDGVQLQPMFTAGSSGLPVGGSTVPSWALDSVTYGDGILVFLALPFGGPHQLVACQGGNLASIVTDSTPVPGSTDHFSSFTNPSTRGGTVVFAANGSSGSPYSAGIYSWDQTSLSVVADTTTDVPGTTSKFTEFNQRLGSDGYNVCFVGWHPDGSGLFTRTESGLHQVIASGTPLPGGGAFGSVWTISMDATDIAFWTYDSGIGNGIFARFGATTTNVIRVGSQLDGRTVVDFRLGPHGLDQRSVVFVANFDDGGTGIYVATYDPWIDLGSGLAGVNGIPSIVGTGTLIGGQPASITLTNAKPSAPAAFFVGLSNAPTAFKGGFLVPVPWALLLAMTTSPSGTISLSFNWPMVIPPALNIYYQYAIKDSAAVQGVALSNALQSTTP